MPNRRSRARRAEAASFRPRKLPRQRRSVATVAAIVEATARVLVERGYNGASTRRIAERAGVSVGSLYQYFPSRDALVTAVIERHVDEVLEKIGTLLRRVERAPLDVQSGVAARRPGMPRAAAECERSPTAAAPRHAREAAVRRHAARGGEPSLNANHGGGARR